MATSMQYLLLNISLEQTCEGDFEQTQRGTAAGG